MRLHLRNRLRRTFTQLLINCSDYWIPLLWDPLTPDPPTNITPTNIAWVKYYRKFPMGLGIPPLKFKIMLESNPLKPTMFVGRLGVPWLRLWVPEGLRACSDIGAFETDLGRSSQRGVPACLSTELHWNSLQARRAPGQIQKEAEVSTMLFHFNTEMKIRNIFASSLVLQRRSKNPQPLRKLLSQTLGFREWHELRIWAPEGLAPSDS